MTLTDSPTRTEATVLDVTLLSGAIGAEIRGVDLSEPLADDVLAAIRHVWLDRKVVFFPGQHLDSAQHIAFASQFGEPTEGHPVIPGIADHPEVFEIDYTASRELYAAYGDIAERGNGVSWHTDVTFVKRPPLGSILRAVEVPPSGGDTLFSDQEAALAALSPALQAFLETLTATHDGSAQFKPILEYVGAGTWEGAAFTALDPVTHPVVRVHPETGRKALFMNPGFTTRINELSRAESDTLLRFLFDHAVQPQFTVRYHWHTGDLGFWDNRATQHSVVGDFGEQHRVIQRVTLRGTEPAGV